MNKLQINIIQKDLVWEQIEANLKDFDRLISENKKAADLWVLPEMFSTGFTMNPHEFAEIEEESLALKFLIKKAQEYQAVFCGSLSIKENSNYYNRLYFVYPDGHYVYYNKRHLFSLAGEEKFYQAGRDRVIVELKGFKILLQVCYDLRFPVFSRNRGDYDLIIYVANWPDRRIHHWNALIPARAIENQAFVIACNRIGKDGNGIEHSGYSKLLNYNGDVLAESKGVEEILSLEIDKQDLIEFRERLNFLKDQDSFSLGL